MDTVGQQHRLSACTVIRNQNHVQVRIIISTTPFFLLQIEREVILSNYDKNSKIPILNEYHKKQKSAAVAPDAPNVQVAWTEDRTNRTVSIRVSMIIKMG